MSSYSEMRQQGATSKGRGNRFAPSWTKPAFSLCLAFWMPRERCPVKPSPITHAWSPQGVGWASTSDPTYHRRAEAGPPHGQPRAQLRKPTFSLFSGGFNPTPDKPPLLTPVSLVTHMQSKFFLPGCVPRFIEPRHLGVQQNKVPAARKIYLF